MNTKVKQQNMSPKTNKSTQSKTLKRLYKEVKGEKNNQVVSWRHDWGRRQ